jgi:flavin reductase (DIM6/NTAB) family NADH-FMN oxidoreductase RutF
MKSDDMSARIVQNDTAGRVNCRSGEQEATARRFRSVLGSFATGVVAVTSRDPSNGEPCGLAVNSFTSVSLDPLLIAVCVSQASTTWPRIRRADSLAVNVLAGHQQDLCRHLAMRGGDKFAGICWSVTPGGNPLIDGCLAWIDCSIDREYPAGDHLMVIGAVRGFGDHASGGPLIFFRGGYGIFHAAFARSDTDEHRGLTSDSWS